jgi:catechol 2,3-dioxygenase-like lactoylglutathione lyase family enzyme
MPAAVAFYRKLGLDFAGDTDAHEEAELPGGIRLMLDTEESIKQLTPDWAPPTGAPRFALAFLLPDPAGVDALYAQLTAAGYRSSREPWDAFWGQRYATVLDPDGNGVDLFAYLPRAA